ncbi:kinase-like domain-containing protein [Cantharellus anzutake]|uniref:kinase-like domain-containing protein n=1 Tax=Cantharellus anzutake TaxID=1750568 RepID=UPI001903CA4A|nr:kinase-like domain-containing protein [Cantharellus anzutake]KAF8329584.1 kinase-like domain-containing protein [Cantharellus anzutake]
MRNWHKLNHPNVNPFYGWAMDKISFGDNLCLVSGFCARYSVSRYLRSEPHPDRWKIIIEIAAGLCYLHQNSIIHGDLKPNNVLVDADGKARLCDFGLSIALSDKLTRPDEPSRFYTPAYLAPEMLEDDNDSENGCRPPTIQSDVWSFGCTAMQVSPLP